MGNDRKKGPVPKKKKKKNCKEKGDGGETHRLKETR